MFNKFSGQSGWRTWTVRYNINHNLTNQPRVCTRFWRKSIPCSAYSEMGTACIAVHKCSEFGADPGTYLSRVRVRSYVRTLTKGI